MSEAPKDFRKSTPYLGVSLEPLTTSDLVPSDSLASLPVLLWVSLVRLLDKLLLVLGEPLAREGLKHQVFNLVPITNFLLSRVFFLGFVFLVILGFVFSVVAHVV